MSKTADLANNIVTTNGPDAEDSNERPQRIMLVTDAWEPQMNGVVRTLSRTVAELRDMGREVEVIHPGLGYKTMPLPTYPEIQLAS